MDQRPEILVVLLAFSVVAPLAAFEPQSEAEQIERLARSVAQDVKQRQAESDAKKRKLDREIQKLQRQFDTNDQAQRRQAISSILSSRDPRFVPVLSELLADPNAYNRKQAIMALYRLQAKSAINKIGALVSSDPDANVRHQAAEYGTRLGYRSSMKEISRFLADESFTSQSAAMHLSNSLPDDQEVQLLATFLDHKAHHLRIRAVQRLMRHEPKLIKPHVVNVLGLADADPTVRRMVAREERMLQELVTSDDLRKLALQAPPFIKVMAYRMLRKRGEDTTAHTLPFLSSKNPEMRSEALLAFRDAGKGPEKEIVALLGDPDSLVSSYALDTTRSLQLRSAVPKLREVFVNGNRYNNKKAARALLEMNESVWEARRQPPAVKGPIFEAVADLTNADKADAWNAVIDGADGIVNELAQLKAFPCKRDDMVKGARVKRHKVMRQGEGWISKRRSIGGNAPQRIQNAVIVHHGDLIVKGIIDEAIVIVTGNLYMHDGYVSDSIVIVQGDFVCGGYIKNSVVIAGENKMLSMRDGRISDSVAAADRIETDSYVSQSLYSGQMVNSGRSDVHNSAQFDAEPIYKRLRDQSAKKKQPAQQQ